MARGKKHIKQTLVSWLVIYLGVCPPFFNSNLILTCTRPALFDAPSLFPFRTRPNTFTIAFGLLTNSSFLKKREAHYEATCGVDTYFTCILPFSETSPSVVTDKNLLTTESLIQAMASPTTTGGNAVSTSNRQIPLFCTVCPEAPRFSDVSHLLTHIASKGHLHHETQTKLKAHQDIGAAVKLQSYEE
jgi:hypothetical protein